MNQHVSIPYQGPRTHAEMIAAKKAREARYLAAAIEGESPPRRKTVDELLAERGAEFAVRLEKEKQQRIEKQIKREIRFALREARNHSELAELRRPAIRKIIYIVAETFGISANDILSARRIQSLTLPRQIAMYLSKSMTFHSLPEVGRQFRRDHSTIHHAVRKIAAMMAADEAFRAKVEAIEAAVKGE